MLVLTRGLHDEIVLNLGLPSEVRIRVAEIRGDRVRIGVKAPQDVSIYRHEVAESILLNGVTRHKRDDTAQPDASVRGAA